MDIGSSLAEICQKLQVLTTALANQADGVLDAKHNIVPPFFANTDSAQQVYLFLQKTELAFYSTLTTQLYQFRSRHFQLFSKLDTIDGGKYHSLSAIADMFLVVERASMEIQQRVYAQMMALEQKQYDVFFVEWYAQQEINARLDKFFEAQGEIIPQKTNVVPFPEQKTEVRVALKKRGIARAAAMIALALTLFVKSLLPSAAAQSQLEPIRFNVPSITARATLDEAKPVQSIIQKIVDVVACAEFTKYWEGFRSVVYKDSLGYLTIGYGTCIDKRIKPDAPQLIAKFGLDYARIIAKDQRVSPQNAQRMLESEIAIARSYAPKAVSTFATLPEYAQLCVVDMIYNLGLNNFLKFKKMIAALEVHDYATAAAEMKDSRWFSQTKQRAAHHVDVMSKLAMQFPVQQQSAQGFRMAA